MFKTSNAGASSIPAWWWLVWAAQFALFVAVFCGVIYVGDAVVDYLRANI